MARLVFSSMDLCLDAMLRRHAWLHLALGLMTLLLAWPAIFSTLALYDDEGYVMMTLQTYMQGHRLYGETHTQYGPAYYFLTTPIHSILDWPLTQTGVRIKTLGFWVISVCLCFAVVRRLSGSIVAGVATSMLAALHLDKLSLEPGHPQEVTLLCTLGGLLLFVRSKHVSSTESPSFLSVSSWLAVSILTCVVGLVKLNCGIVLAVPLLLTAAIQSKIVCRFRWGLLPIVFIPSLAVAWCGRSSPIVSLWALWLGACAGTLLLSSIPVRNHESRSSMAHLIAVIVGGVLTSVLILGLALQQGISVSELWLGIVGQHSHFAAYFFVPLQLTSVPFIGLLSALAVLFLRRLESYQGSAKFAIWIWVALSMALTAFLPLEHGLNPRGAGLLLAWAAPGWIVWMWREDVAHCPKKLFLGLVAILSPLIAFPVSGTQVQIGTLPALIVVGIFLGDFLVASASRFVANASNSATPYDEVAVRLAFASVVFIFVAASLTHWYRYADGQPLGLPGSAYMRLPSAMVDEQRTIAAAIQRSGASNLLFEGNNHNRFYFWTSLKPLTPASPTFWPLMLFDSEQQQLAEAIDRRSRLCVVRVPQYEYLYFGHADEIRQRIDERWQPTEAVGEWQIGVVD